MEVIKVHHDEYHEQQVFVGRSPLDIMSLKGLLGRWARTYQRICPATHLTVTFEQVMAGQYSLERINADSKYGYEVYPSHEYLDHLTESLTAFKIKYVEAWGKDNY